MTATSVSRRVESSIAAYSKKDYEEAFIHLFPAIDKTAKRRIPKGRVAERIKAFLHDENKLITGIATKNVMDIAVDGIDLPTALYKFGRTSIAHEGELDERLTINNTGSIEIGRVWNLPSSYVFGMTMAVVLAPENSDEQVASAITFELFDNSYELNEMWGEVEAIKSRMCDLWRSPDLFKDKPKSTPHHGAR